MLPPRRSSLHVFFSPKSSLLHLKTTPSLPSYKSELALGSFSFPYLHKHPASATELFDSDSHHSNTRASLDLSRIHLNHHSMEPSCNPSDESAAVVSEIEALLRLIASWKVRSHDTSKFQHIPLLRSLEATQSGPAVVLIGDSMLERMITTGESPNFVQPWPSPAMLDDAELARLNSTSPDARVERLQGVLNVGVGGDRIQNIAYRLVGNSSPDPAKDLPALAPLLEARKSVKLWVVHAGTNNINPKKGLTNAHRDALRVVLRALLKISSAQVDCRILVTGLFPRLDVPGPLMDEANVKLLSMVRDLNAELGKERVVFLPATEEVKTDKHFVDHVHLGLEGYKIWTKALFPAVTDLLRKVEEEEEQKQKRDL
ncbi:SGNH hydrolase-type esterase domain-containing protein [Podospora appendiculata]|uniref:SGNH hydrolase-type esterase domain-containing protein n=1 Tax=Podospora appendiculata TaxID=314037 RepID=A0AAE1CCK8_9PEZI|nr:SGNH hydrolase-type esterase domain-containing protein [Podospora appendiculata]